LDMWCLNAPGGQSRPRLVSDCPYMPLRGSRQNAVSDPSAHAAVRLRLCAGQCRPRHAGAASLSWSQEYSARGALHRAVAASVQGLLALIVGDRGSDHAPAGFEVMGNPQDVMVWAVPSLCGLLLGSQRALFRRLLSAQITSRVESNGGRIKPKLLAILIWPSPGTANSATAPPLGLAGADFLRLRCPIIDQRSNGASQSRSCAK
jgi:hypothetical protein